jgi:protein O-mannosyl-transferase
VSELPTICESGWSKRLVAAALLVVVTIVAYWPCLHGGFIFDDNVFLTENPLIKAPDGLARFWFSREALDYWPMTSTTLWLEWRLWGMKAAGYHATNLALHVSEVLLLWAVLRRLGVRGAFWAAAIFALHPLNAETVTWITQRKNLVAMLFCLLSTYWFVASEGDAAVAEPKGSANGVRAISYYLLSLVAFVLAMLSKGSVVVWPIVLFGIVSAQRRPRASDIKRLLPFLIAAVGLAWFESTFSTVVEPISAPPALLESKLLRAAAIGCFYLGKVVWPAQLSFDYGLWPSASAIWWGAALAVVVITVLLWQWRTRGTRAGWYGWAYFWLTLLPVLGFVEVGFMKYSPVSNHYAHLAIIGVAALAGVIVARLRCAGRPIRRGLTHLLLAIVVIGLGLLTWRQCEIYADGERLYRDTIARNPNSALAHTNLGALMTLQGKFDAAIFELQTAIRLTPDSVKAHDNLGVAFYRLGRIDDAIREYRGALQLDPEFCDAHNNLGAALARSGHLSEAIEEFKASLRINPDYANARNNLERAEKMVR